MADVKYTAAVKVFNKIDKYLTAKNWKYDKDTNKLEFIYHVGGDDFPMRFILRVDAEREMIRSISFMPFDFSEDKRIEGAIAVCVANMGMLNGCFGYNITDGTVFHKVVVPYMDIEVSDDMIEYIMGLGMAMVDKYNDRFFALNKGFISIAEFIEKQ